MSNRVEGWSGPGATGKALAVGSWASRVLLTILRFLKLWISCSSKLFLVFRLFPVPWKDWQTRPSQSSCSFGLASFQKVHEGKQGPGVEPGDQVGRPDWPRGPLDSVLQEDVQCRLMVCLTLKPTQDTFTCAHG